MQQLATSIVAPDGKEKRLLPLSVVRQLAHEWGLSVREIEIRALKARILPARYERNQGTVGWEGQIKLLESTVAIVGGGGLGGWVIEGLARMGVGHLTIIDGDAFEENNLNRQALCTEVNLGQLKTEAARERVARVNSATEVTIHPVMADEESMREMLAGADVVVDALDTLPTRLVLQKVAQGLGIPVVHGAIGGYVGQVMTVFPGDEGLYALYGRGDVPERGIEAQLGNPAATPMMVAAWQIQEVIKILLGTGELLRNRLLFMDAESGVAEVLEIGR
ncbi:MAG: HesA/MoeB/ThiF family protein [Anaerolineales bacterium]|nr:MAG: HesA/MoeB/ThiF family protein [Anaerolineales bacterium]